MKDNQPKHRQRSRENLKLDRKNAYRKQYPTALIACEGKKTEPNYILGFVEDFQLTPNVRVIRGESDSDALSIVKRARESFCRSPDYDRVFVLMDGDQRNLAKAIEACKTPIQQSNKRKGLEKIVIEPIVTVPCFEYWLLLHFLYTDRPYTDCDNVVNDLIGYLPEYQKGDRLIYKKLKSGLMQATENVDLLKQSLLSSNSEYPNTDMHILIRALFDMRR